MVERGLYVTETCTLVHACMTIVIDCVWMPVQVEILFMFSDNQKSIICNQRNRTLQ